MNFSICKEDKQTLVLGNTSGITEQSIGSPFIDKLSNLNTNSLGEEYINKRAGIRVLFRNILDDYNVEIMSLGEDPESRWVVLLGDINKEIIPS